MQNPVQDLPEHATNLHFTEIEGHPIWARNKGIQGLHKTPQTQELCVANVFDASASKHALLSQLGFCSDAGFGRDMIHVLLSTQPVV